MNDARNSKGLTLAEHINIYHTSRGWRDFEVDDSAILLETLTRTQQECTRLLLENRKLKDEEDKLLALLREAQYNWNELIKEKAENWKIYTREMHLKRLRLEE